MSKKLWITDLKKNFSDSWHVLLPTYHISTWDQKHVFCSSGHEVLLSQCAMRRKSASHFRYLTEITKHVFYLMICLCVRKSSITRVTQYVKGGHHSLNKWHIYIRSETHDVQYKGKLKAFWLRLPFYYLPPSAFRKEGMWGRSQFSLK